MEWRGAVPSMTLNCSHGPPILVVFFFSVMVMSFAQDQVTQEVPTVLRIWSFQ